MAKKTTAPDLATLIAGSGALVGHILGFTLEISTASLRGCSGPCTDGQVVHLPKGWLVAYRIFDQATIVAILAHEAAHVQTWDGAGWPNEAKSEELRADWIAGYVVGRLGLSAVGFKELLRRLPRGRSHPLAWIRGEVTLSGWTAGRAQATMCALA